MEGAPPSYEDASTTKGPYPPEKPPYPTGNTAPYPTGNTAPYPTGNTAGASGSGGPPPPSVYVPPTQYAATPAPQAAVVVTQPMVVVHHNPFGFIPASVTCPHCQQPTMTQLEFRNGGATWLACGITCLVGCWLFCCLIPFCIDALKDAVHKCGHCGHEIGYRKRLS